MKDMALVLGLVATVVAIVGGLGTLMKWLLDAQIGGLRSEMNVRFDGVDRRIDGLEKRVGNLEADMHVVKARLIGASADS